MNPVFDVVNTLLIVWVKPMIVIAVLMYVVSKPDFRSAATNHWLLLMAVFSPVLLIVFFSVLPEIDIGILPSNLAAYTEATIFYPALSPLAHPNILTLLLFAVYLVGFVFILVNLLLAISNTRKLVKNAEQIDNPKITKLVEELSAQFEIKKNVEIRTNAKISSPLMWGVISPQILLPAQYLMWEEARLRRVLAHELAHIARGDWLSKILSHLLCALFWINPLIWRAAKQGAWYAELACDDLVVSKLHCRAEYADDLLELSTDASHLQLAVLAFIKKSELYMRINAILDGGKNRNAPGFILKSVILASVIVLLLPISALQAKQSPYELRAKARTSSELVGVHSLQRDFVVIEDQPTVEQKDYLAPEEVRKKCRLDVPKALTLSSTHLKPVTQLASVDTRKHKQIITTYDVSPDVQFKALEVLPHKPLKVVTPKYPRSALSRNLEATVVVALDVDMSGKVINPRIVSTEHSKVFNSSVLKAIKNFVYRPMTIDGRPIITRNVKETFVFTLEDTADIPK